MLHNRYIDDMATAVYLQNCDLGWWPRGDAPGSLGLRAVMLIIGECCEAVDADRSDNPPDKHLPEFDSRTIELADVFLRLADLGGRLNIKLCSPYNNTNRLADVYLSASIAASRPDIHRASSFPEYILVLVEHLCRLAAAIRAQMMPEHVRAAYGSAMSALISIAEISGISTKELKRAISAKFRYNASRADHQPGTRELKY